MSAKSSSSRDPQQPAGAPRRRTLRWVLVAVAVVFFLAMLREVLDPFGEKGYTAISHGNHSHYVPADRDPNVPVHEFPTRPPGPNERIMPDGRIVPK